MKLSKIWTCVNIATTMLLLVSELSRRLKKKRTRRETVLGRLCSRNCQIRVFYSWLYTFIMC